jgi:1,4-dihydroxy-2-naphthoate octaprenyltransferase
MPAPKTLMPGTSAPMGRLKIWMLAARPKTLTAGVIPVTIGIVLAGKATGEWNWFIAALTLSCSVLIQIGINLINDGLDFKKGADNNLRIGFIRVTQSGLISLQSILRGGWLCFALATLIGIPLMLHGGWPLSLMLSASIIFGYLYTGGPFPLAYHGLGDIFAFAFFGIFTTTIAYYLQTGTVDYAPVLAGTQIGLLATAMIGINNFRDIKSDAHVKKRTLAVIWGATFARIEITVVSFTPFVLGLLWGKLGNPYAAIYPCLMLPITFANIKAIWIFDPSPLYNQLFARSAFIHAMFGALLALGFL